MLVEKLSQKREPRLLVILGDIRRDVALYEEVRALTHRTRIARTHNAK